MRSRNLLFIVVFALIGCDESPTAPNTEFVPTGFSISVNGLRVETIADVNVAMCDLCLIRYDWGDQSAPSEEAGS